MTAAIPGECLCGAVHIAVAPPYRWFAHCHCSMCRKQFGTPFATGLGVAAERFEWLAGQAEIVHYRASAAFERPFCRRCGAKLPALSQDGRTWNVPAGLLIGNPAARPRTHIFVGSRASFAPITDDLPQHHGYPARFGAPELAPPRRQPTGAAVEGSCLCDTVAFAAEAVQQRILYCYCSLCRRSRGAAFASTLRCKATAFRWLRGREQIRTFTLAGSRYRTDFCRECGSPLPLVAQDSDVARLPAGVIDTELAPLPAVHTCVASKASWYEITDAWPQFAERIPGE